MKKINIKKQLKPIKEENYDKKRPQSAKNIHNVITTKYTDGYTASDSKHKGIKQGLKNYETDDDEIDAQGGFNNFFKFNDKIGLSVPQAGTNAFNKDFNTIFVSTLLDICGEKTIDSGKEQDRIYFDLGKNDLWDATMTAFKNNHFDFSREAFKYMEDTDFKVFNQNEQAMIKAFLIVQLFATDELFTHCRREAIPAKDIYSFLQTFGLNERDLTFISRVLCKIFLLQMYDRKPENTVVFEDKDGKIDFCEIDFDDNPFEKDFVSTIFCQLISSNDTEKEKENIKERWHDKLRVLINDYRELVKNNSSIEKSFKEMIENYTMTPQKIEELIKKTALKAEYMGLNETKVIDGINEKIKLWKEMLKDKDNGAIVNQISGVEEARTKTLKALRQITKQDVENIVNSIITCHNYSYNNQKSKDDTFINKDIKEIIHSDKLQTIYNGITSGKSIID